LFFNEAPSVLYTLCSFQSGVKICVNGKATKRSNVDTINFLYLLCMRFRLLAALLCFLSGLFSAAQPANRFDVLITELMADPTPAVGLPAAEYIELKNISATTYNLLGWRISDATSTVIINQSILLAPDSFLIICAASNAPFFEPFGTTLSLTNFPSLNNDGDTLTLFSAEGKTIHAVAYDKSWYGVQTQKSDGGWSLEMLNLATPCWGSNNWAPSTSAVGGTPGKTNSVNSVLKDETQITLLQASAIDSLTILLFFNQPVDSLSGATATNYKMAFDGVITGAETVSPLFTSVRLTLSKPLKKGVVYTVTATGIVNCIGKGAGVSSSIKTGLPEEPQLGDLVINEILFNPKTGGHDYVELYNQSAKIISASSLLLANRNSTGAVASAKKLSLTPFPIFPGNYVVITEDAALLEQYFFVKDRSAVIAITSMPSFPDNEGTVVVTNLQGTVIDEVRYKDDWHFGLITNAEGVALERTHPSMPSQDAGSWHSAAATAGYGTPGYENSQFKQATIGAATISINPKIFSPDGDGFNDAAIINYTVSESGFVANVFVFDGAGREVRHLVKNELLGFNGAWNWDGLGENRQRLPTGTYIIYTELFNLKGKKHRFKNAVVIAQKQ